MPYRNTYSANGAAAVTPSDVTVFPISRGLYIGGTGDVAVKMYNDTTVTFSSVPPGEILPINVKQVLATGTTATNIVRLYD